MATLARLFDFAAGTPIVSGDVDAEFNQLVNILNGSSSSKNAIIKYNDAATPPLQCDQIGAGRIQDWLQTGILKASVTNAGAFSTTNQFISTLAPGAPPLVVSSPTLVANLNADLVDGLHGTQFLRNDAASSLSASDATSLLDVNQTGAGAIARFRLSGVDKVVIANDGNIKITNAAPKLTFEDTTGGEADWEMLADANIFKGRFVGGSDLISFNNATGLMTTGGHVVVGDLDVSGNIFRTWKHLVADATSNTVANGDLTSFTVNAGILPTNGSRIKFEAAGTGMNNGETVTVQFNGVTIGSISQGDTATTVWYVTATIIRLSDTSVRCIVRATREHINYADGTVGETRTFNSDISVNSLSGSTNIFKCVSTGTLTQNWLGGEFLQA